MLKTLKLCFTYNILVDEKEQLKESLQQKVQQKKMIGSIKQVSRMCQTILVIDIAKFVTDVNVMEMTNLISCVSSSSVFFCSSSFYYLSSYFLNLEWDHVFIWKKKANLIIVNNQ